MRTKKLGQGGEERAEGAPPSQSLVSGKTPLEIAEMVRSRFYNDRDYARKRRRTWRKGATVIQLGSILSATVATIILGLSDLPRLAQVGFGFTAMVAALNALEPFLNFRSRWILAEESLAQWHELEEGLEIYVATTPVEELDTARLLHYDQQRREVWSHFSARWIAARWGDQAPDTRLRQVQFADVRATPTEPG